MYVVHAIPIKTKSKNIYRYLQKVFSSTKHKWEEKKSRSERKVSEKQLIEESNDYDEVISNVGGNNSSDDLSELDDEMEIGSTTDNLNNFFYFATRINLHTFLAEQIASVLSMS